VGGYHHRDGVPYIDDLPVQAILDEHPTPLVVYSASRLRDNARALRHASARSARILYSYKACYLAGVLSVLHSAGLDAEVCSGREYLLARAMGLAPGRIAWNAVGLSDAEVRLAVTGGVSWLGLNSLTDIDRVAAAATAADRDVTVLLRIQPEDVPSAYIGPGSRLGFGTSDGMARQAVERVLACNRLHLRGLHSHTQVRQVDPALHVQVVRSSLRFAESVYAATDLRLRTVSVGGGLGCRAELRRHGLDGSEFVAAVLAARDEIDPSVEVAFEPGRFLVSDAAVGLTSVLSAAGSDSHPWLIVDLGTQLLVPFEGRQFPVERAFPSLSATVTMGVGDRMSSYSGVLTTAAELPAVPDASPLAVLDSGAYTSSVAQRFMYGIPEVIMVNDGRIEPLWRAEADHDWVAHVMAGGLPCSGPPVSSWE
jgi:diaminopimelate decarboxylase